MLSSKMVYWTIISIQAVEFGVKTFHKIRTDMYMYILDS